VLPVPSPSPSCTAERGPAGSTESLRPPPPPRGEVQDSPAPIVVDGWERVPVEHGGYKRRRVGEAEDSWQFLCRHDRYKDSCKDCSASATGFERGRTRSTSGTAASACAPAAVDSGSELDTTDGTRREGAEAGAPAGAPAFGEGGGHNSDVLSIPPSPGEPYPGLETAGDFDVSKAHMVTDDRGALHMVTDDHGSSAPVADPHSRSRAEDAHADPDQSVGKAERKPRPRQLPGTYVAGGDTVSQSSEAISDRAAAARKENEKWRHKPRRSQFRGVVWDQKAAHWRVEVRAPGGLTRINCGTWDDEADAGRAYDREASQFPGKELNFDPETGEPRPRNGPSTKKPRTSGERPKIKKTRKPKRERSWGHHRDMDDMNFHSHGTRARSMSKDSSGSTTSSASGSSMYSYSSYDDNVSSSNYKYHDEYPRPKYPTGGNPLQSLLLAAASMDDSPRRW